MAEQLHRIKRQILEIKLPEGQATPSFYAELRDIYDRRLAPLIEACCSESVGPDQIYRIDRLQLDLGVLDLRDLEADLVAKVGVQLRKKLSESLFDEETENAEHESDSPTHSQVELLVFFARTGALPWWADVSNPILLDDAIQVLRQNSPEVLSRLLESLSREDKSLKRIVRHFDDATLLALSLLGQVGLAPLFGNVRASLLVLLKSSPLKRGCTDHGLRNILWEEIFKLSYATQEKTVHAHIFWRDVVVRMARHFVCASTVLIDELRQTLSLSKLHLDPEVVKMFETLFLENDCSVHQEKITQKSKKPDFSLKKVSDDSPVEIFLGEGPADHGFEEILMQLKQAGGFFEPLFAPLRLLLNALPPVLFPQFLSTLKSLNLAKTGIPSEDESMKETLRQMFLDWVSQEGVSQAQIGPCLRALLDEKPRRSSDVGFADAEELYVENAGLVILWPFLTHFFKHMDLMDKEGFKDRTSLHRAVLLLQNLVTEDKRPAEYHLALNRVLCGMSLDTVIEQETPISEKETSECEALLEAVIAQVPILKKMSPRGFRGTFLIRKGVLRIRDGMWLLRVNRNDFDVVLDHFPWSMGWVKLSTMSQAMQVEW